MTARPELSFVIPLLNEEGALEDLYAQLTDVLKGMGRTYEIIFVNDGSTDRSGEIIDRLAKEDPRVGVIHFRRNFGKAAGLDAGFQIAQGDYVFTMDADLQDEPTEVPNMLNKLLDEKWDLVSGWKQKRHDPLGKTLPSKLFNYVVSRTSGLHLKDFNCGFKVYRREAIQDLHLYGELHRYVPVLVHWRGFRVTQLAVKHNPRTTGVSKYGVERMLKGFFDLLTVLLITRYRARPLHMFGLVGSLMGFAGIGLLTYLTVLWFLGMGPIGSRPLMTLGFLLIVVGMQFFSIGLLGEMVNNTRPRENGGNYVIRAVTRPRSTDQQLREVSDEESADAEGHPAVLGPGERPHPSASA